LTSSTRSAKPAFKKKLILQPQQENMSEKPNIPEEVIWSKIYELRGQKVMLDRDLAELYDVKAIRLREQVKRYSSALFGK